MRAEPTIAQVHAFVRLARKAVRRVVASAPCAVADVGHGSLRVRALKGTDLESWRAARLANGARMATWWGVQDWERFNDGPSFFQHLFVWRRKERTGHGYVRVIVDRNDDVIGEVFHWNMEPDGDAFELGVWIRPLHDQRADFHRLLIRHYEECFRAGGINRIDAPVPAGNVPAARLMEATGFTREAVIPQWRMVGAVRSDFELWGLTRARWESVRAELLGLLTPVPPQSPVTNGADSKGTAAPV